MQILAVSGSISVTSTTTKLLRAAISLAPAGVAFTLYDGLADLPHFSPEQDSDSPPTPVRRWRELLGAADGVFIATPEYAYSMPGALKNALEWVVSSGEFVEKPVAAISGSPYATGGERGLASLLLTLTVLSAAAVAEGTLPVPFTRTVLHADGTITDPATTDALRSVLAALVRAVEARRDEAESDIS